MWHAGRTSRGRPYGAVARRCNDEVAAEAMAAPGYVRAGMAELIINTKKLLIKSMELTTAAVPLDTTAIMPDITVHDAAAWDPPHGLFGGSDPGDASGMTAGLTVRASFCSCCEFAGAAASANDAAALFPPPGMLPHDWQPSLSRTQSPQDADVFVYNDLGADGCDKRLADLDYFSLAFVKACGGLALTFAVCVAGALPDMPEHERGGLSGEEAAGAVEKALNLDGTRGISAEYGHGHAATEEAARDICGMYGGTYEYAALPDVRVMPYGMSVGNTIHEEWFESVYHMADEFGETGRDDAGHDDAQWWN